MIPVTPAFIHGAFACEQGEGWLRPWRLDPARRTLYGHDGLVWCGGVCSGIRLALRTSARALRLLVLPDAEKARPIDLCLDGEVVQQLEIPLGADALEISGLPAGDKRLECWLPHHQAMHLRGLDCAAVVSPVAPQGLRWLHYGSSISHGDGASRPCCTWPSRVARALGWDLHSFGFSGNCHLDSAVARNLRDCPADLITLKLGINVAGGKSLSERSFQAATLGLIQLIRERQPRAPIALISPIFCAKHEAQDYAPHLNLQQMRSSHLDTCRRFAEWGDDRILAIDGLELLGPAQAGLMPDGVHPSDAGYAHIAERFQALVAPRLLAIR
jgi:lysophospholipase L1-like esterase